MLAKNLAYFILVLPLISPATLDQFLNLFQSMFECKCINRVPSFCKFVALTSALHAYAGHALFWITPSYASVTLPGPPASLIPSPASSGALSPVACFSSTDQLMQSPHSSHLLYQALTLWAIHTGLNEPRTKYQATRDSSCAPQPTEIIQIILNLLYPFVPTEAAIEAFGHSSPFSLLHDQARCFLMWPPPLGNSE